MSIAPCISDDTALRKAFAQYPSGLAALAARVEGEDHVLLVATFSVGISLSPPLVSFAVQRQSTTWPVLCKAKTIGVSILSSDQGELCRQLGGKDKSARWNGIDVERRVTGSVFIENAALSFECAIHAQYPAGDHEIVLLDVKSFSTPANLDPLVFHQSRFRSLEAIA